VKDDVNMRVFEALGCGSLLVTNRIGPGQDLLFKNGEHLIEYENQKDLIEVVGYYLAHGEERERIAAQGRAQALKKHTYAHRLDYMLSFFKPLAARSFDFSHPIYQGDLWAYEQSALAPWCHGRGIDEAC
jgi:spore maturation protein CgeB